MAKVYQDLLVGNVFHKKNFQIFQLQVKNMWVVTKSKHRYYRQGREGGCSIKNLIKLLSDATPSKSLFSAACCFHTFVYSHSFNFAKSLINPGELEKLHSLVFVRFWSNFKTDPGIEFMYLFMYLVFPETFISASFKSSWRCRLNNQQVSKIYNWIKSSSRHT